MQILNSLARASNPLLVVFENNVFDPEANTRGWNATSHTNYSVHTPRLIGTLIPCDGKSQAQAILQKKPAGKTYTVMIGGQLDTNTTLIDIQPKQVILEERGQRRTLTLNTTPWLK